MTDHVPPLVRALSDRLHGECVACSIYALAVVLADFIEQVPTQEKDEVRGLVVRCLQTPRDRHGSLRLVQ